MLVVLTVHCRMVAFRARLDYLSQSQLRAVLIRRAELFAEQLRELNRLDPRDKNEVRQRLYKLVMKNNVGG